MITNGKHDELKVGNIDINRDFDYALSFVEAMHSMLQMDNSDDFIICSGSSISLRTIIEYVFSILGLPTSKNQISNDLFTPNDILDMYRNPTKAKEKLKCSTKYPHSN